MLVSGRFPAVIGGWIAVGKMDLFSIALMFDVHNVAIINTVFCLIYYSIYERINYFGQTDVMKFPNQEKKSSSVQRKRNSARACSQYPRILGKLEFPIALLLFVFVGKRWRSTFSFFCDPALGHNVANMLIKNRIQVINDTFGCNIKLVKQEMVSELAVRNFLICDVLTQYSNVR